MPIARGFAVKDTGGEIIVNTVSLTRRAAKVNWLVVQAHIAMDANVSDGFIDRVFLEEAGNRGHIMVEVEIKERE